MSHPHRLQELLPEAVVHRTTEERLVFAEVVMPVRFDVDMRALTGKSKAAIAAKLRYWACNAVCEAIDRQVMGS